MNGNKDIEDDGHHTNIDMEADIQECNRYVDETTERVSDDVLKSRIAGIEHISHFEFPPQRYCDICQMTQPYRTKHCRECDKCVRKYDHHCFWIGGCVGELNHRKFILFLLLKTFSLVLSFDVLVSGYDRANYVNDKNQEFHQKGIFMVLGAIAAAFVFFSGLLLFYHIYLMMTNQTTWEHSRRPAISYLRVYPKSVFPFDYGIKQNMMQLLFHENKVREWVLRHPHLLKVRNGFNYCENEYYNCC